MCHRCVRFVLVTNVKAGPKDFICGGEYHDVTIIINKIIFIFIVSIGLWSKLIESDP